MNNPNVLHLNMKETDSSVLSTESSEIPTEISEETPSFPGHNTNEEDSVCSIFSFTSFDVLSEDEYSYGYSSDESEDSLDERNEWYSRWQAMERSFARRERMIKRLSRKKNGTLMNLIRKREKETQQQERELMLMLLKREKGTRVPDGPDSSESKLSTASGVPSLVVSLCESDSSEILDLEEEDDQSVYFDSNEKCTLTKQESTSLGVLVRLYEACIMEYFLTGPALCSFVIHTLAHVSLSDGVESAVEAFSHYCYLLSTRYPLPVDSDVLALGIAFLCGVTMLRVSGYLYWWANPNDFHCVKLDYHNRLRSNGVWARLLAWAKRHPLFQGICFCVGYLLCFKVIEDTFELSFALISQHESILSGLPSSQANVNGQSYFPGSTSVGLGWLDDRECQFADTTLYETTDIQGLMDADVDYLNQNLYFKSLQNYWMSWAENTADPSDLEEPPLVGPLTAMAYCLAVSILCRSILSYYGVQFLEKF